MAQINWTSQALHDLELIADFIARDASSFLKIVYNECNVLVGVINVYYSS